MRFRIRHGNSVAIVERLTPSDPDWKYRSGGRWIVTFAHGGRIYGGGLSDMWAIVEGLRHCEEAHA